MQIAATTDLPCRVFDLEKIEVIHPGNESWPLAPRIRALGLSRIFEELEPLR